MNRRMFLWLAILAALLGVVAAYSFGRMAAGRQSALAAEADLADCVRLAGQIEGCRARPNLAAEFERASSETAGPIERAAKTAGISAERLLRISPEPAQRIGETVYKEKPTRVYLENVSLRQIVACVHNVLAAGLGLRAKSIRLSSPRPDDSADVWNAEIVLTYLIYEPPRPANQEVAP